MNIFRLLAVLLDYPGDDVLADLREAVAETGASGAAGVVAGLDQGQRFSSEERQSIAGFLVALLAMEATEAKQRYVQTFDLVPEHSLHLTHHIFGEEKTRGPALIDLSEYLKTYGFTHDDKELPDFLPLLLEFVAHLDEDESRVFLGDAAKVLRVIAANLEAAESPYAPLVRIIENHGSLVKLAA